MNFSIDFANKPYFTILSLDGGGVRGALTAAILKKIAEKNPKFQESIDLVCGTSIGSVLAALICDNHKMESLPGIFLELGNQIFKDSILDDIKDGGRLFGAEYSNSDKLKVMTQVFGNKTLGDLKKNFLSTAFLLDNKGKSKMDESKLRSWELRVYDNEKGQNPDLNLKIVDVLMGATAAPTYWPIYHGVVDGGILHNNPCLVGITEAIKRGVPMEKIRVLSLGTGEVSEYMETTGIVDKGIAGWGKDLINILLSNDRSVNYMAQAFLGKRFFRYSPELTKFIDLDDQKKIPELINIGLKTDISGIEKFLNS